MADPSSSYSDFNPDKRYIQLKDYVANRDDFSEESSVNKEALLKEKEKFNPAVDKYDTFGTWLRRFEDFNSSHIYGYITNMLRNLYRDEEGKKHLSTYVMQGFRDSEDPDKITLPNEMLTQEPDYTLNNESDYDLLVDAMFHLERLFRLSPKFEYHMPTLVKACEMAKKSKEGTGLNINQVDLLKTGEIYKYFYTAAKGWHIATLAETVTTKPASLSEPLNWYFGINDVGKKYPSFRQDITMLLRDFNKLGIDITQEDMRMCDADFFRRINVHLPTPDKRYVPEVFSRLKTTPAVIKIRDYSEPIDPYLIQFYQTAYETTPFFRNYIYNVWNNVDQHDEAETYIRRVVNRINYYRELMNQNANVQYTFKTVDYEDLTYNNNLAYADDQLLAIYGNYAFFDETDEDVVLAVTDCGLVVALSNKYFDQQQLYAIGAFDLCQIFANGRDTIDYNPNEMFKRADTSLYKQWVDVYGE